MLAGMLILLSVVKKLFSETYHYKFNDFLFASGDFVNKIEIFEKNGLEPLICLLASTDCDIQVNYKRNACEMYFFNFFGN